MRAVAGAALLATLVRRGLRPGVARVSPKSQEKGKTGHSRQHGRGPARGRTDRAPVVGWFYAQAMAPLSWKPLGNGEPAGYVALKPTFAVPPGPIVAMYTAGVSVAWSPLRVRVELNG
jgi:hypothetical protein